MTTETKFVAVERRFADGTVGRLGTVRKSEDGYHFTPAVSGRKPSRKAHPTLKDCLPSWVGYPNSCETRWL